MLYFSLLELVSVEHTSLCFSRMFQMVLLTLNMFKLPLGGLENRWRNSTHNRTCLWSIRMLDKRHFVSLCEVELRWNLL